MPSGSPWIPARLDYPGVDNPFVESRLSLVKRISLEIKPPFCTLFMYFASFNAYGFKSKTLRERKLSMNDTFVKNGERIDRKFCLSLSFWSLSKKKVKTVLICSSFLINFPYRITRVVENRVNPISSYERIPIFSFRYEKFHAFLFNVTVLTFEHLVLNRTRRLRVNIYARNNPDLLLTPRHLRIKINYGLRRRYSFMNARVTNDPLSGAITRRCRRDNDFAG